VIAGGRIFITGDTDDVLIVRAFDLQGRPLWQATNGAAWTRSWPGARAACAVSDGRVFHMNAHGRVVALDAATGRELWAVNVLERFEGHNITWALSECLLVDGPRTLVTAGGAKALMAALDTKTGATVWQSDPLRLGPSPSDAQQRLAEPAGEVDSAGYASPILFRLGGRRHIVNCSNRHVFGVDADTGSLLWTRPMPTRYRVLASTPVLWRDRVFVTGPDGEGGRMFRIVDGGDGVRVETAWTSPMDTGQHGVTVVGDRMYGPFYRQADRWVCVDPSTGGVEYETREMSMGASIHADGRLYCVTQSGDVRLVEPGPSGFRMCGRFRLAPTGKPVRDCWTHPVLLDGRLYLRHHDVLFCLDVRAPQAGA
jgi:outer membrane protein assembly factor BamB